MALVGVVERMLGRYHEPDQRVRRLSDKMGRMGISRRAESQGAKLDQPCCLGLQLVRAASDIVADQDQEGN